MRVLNVFGLFLLCSGIISAQAPTPASPTGPAQSGRGSSGESATAHATLVDAKGTTVGEAQLQETPHGVLLQLALKDIPAGRHALHVHGAGKCEAPAFTTAGGHYAPDGRKHGLQSPEGPHTGDLPNIDVPASKALVTEQFVAHVTLKPGPRSLLDADGSAIVVHAGPDDHRTDPAGDAGGRIACGVIRAR